jgi:hypothetical protein
MARHVHFDIVIGCISRLLDSVFFIIETDYRIFITTRVKELPLYFYVSSDVEYAVDFLVPFFSYE